MTKRERVRLEIIRLFHKGYGSIEMKEELCPKFNITEKTFYVCLETANKELEKLNEYNKKYSYTLHLNRYEHIYKDVYSKLEGLGEEYKPTQYKYFVALVQALFKAMFHKEKLLGLKEKDVVIKIVNNNIIMDKNEETVGLHNKLQPKINNLTIEEKRELHGLIMKSEILAIDGVWPVRRVPIGMEIQDIQHVEKKKEKEDDMPENVIEKMEVEKDEVKEETKKNILENIEKKLQEKSKEQLLSLLEKKKKGEVL